MVMGACVFIILVVECVRLFAKDEIACVKIFRIVCVSIFNFFI